MPSRRTHVIAPLGLVAVLAAHVVSCGGEPAGIPSTLAIGTWGGDNAGAIVTDSGTHVHVGCTYGDVLGVIDLDTDGEFSRDGSYLMRAYPIAVGPTMPARFDGRVRGTTLTLVVTVDDTIAKETRVFGPVAVQFGKEPRLGPCPICRSPRALLR